MEMQSILLLNGPNLDMLGTREPEVYGSTTLSEIETMVATYAAGRGIAVSRFQSNSEGDLVNVIHAAPSQFQGIIYNPGAHTHYSYALRDAISSIDTPVVEVHISDVDAREPFRRISVIAPACIAQVKGLGLEGYCRAVDILCEASGLARLGEGYEARFAEGLAVKIAGHEGIRAEQGDMQSPAQGAPAEEKPAAGDLTEPFAEAVASEDHLGDLNERLARVRSAVEQMGVDALLVRDTSNIRWITSIDGVFDEERAHALLVTPNSAALHTDSRYSNAIRMKLDESTIPVSDERVSHVAFARKALEGDRGKGAGKVRLAFEDSIAYAEYAKAVQEFGTDSLAACSDVVVGLRSVKSGAELNRMRAAQAITDAAFEHIVSYIKVGMTEREVQLELEDYMLRHGADGLAFGSIVATGANGADPHAIPGRTRLEAGQCVVLDFGARAFGYCSDMTRVVFLGEPEGRMAEAWRVLRQANETVERMLRPGVTGKQAHELAEQVLSDGGFAGKMGHGLGHGVGIDVHEQPLLSPRNEKALAVGNVVTVEPGIYLPGEFGMRLEDCGVLTQDGYEVFSRLGHEMVVI